MIDPRTIVELDALVHKLEILADGLQTLAQGDNWEDPQIRLFSVPARETKSTLAKLKVTAFEMAWSYFKKIHGLRNADDDTRAKQELAREFSISGGLKYGLLERYFQNLGGQADTLALQAIVKEARAAVPHRFFDPCYGEEKGKPADLVRNGTVKLRLWRDNYHPERMSTHSLEELTALDKLGQIVVQGVKPSEARTGRLTQEYAHRDDASGKRKFRYGAFVGAQSFKNARFDLKFKDQETALDFAHMLATGQPRTSTVLQVPLVALEPGLVGEAV